MKALAILVLLLSTPSFGRTLVEFPSDTKVPEAVQNYLHGVLKHACKPGIGVFDFSYNHENVIRLRNDKAYDYKYELGIVLTKNIGGAKVEHPLTVEIGEAEVANPFFPNLHLEDWNVASAGEWCESTPEPLKLSCGDHWLGMEIELTYLDNVADFTFSGDSNPSISQGSGRITYEEGRDDAEQLIVAIPGFVGAHVRLRQHGVDADWQAFAKLPGWAREIEIPSCQLSR